jgi:FkbM family methyltransferase
MDIKGFLHVGGHHGQEAPLYKEMGISNGYFFEPIQRSYERMKKNIFDYTPIHCALGSKEETAIIYIENQNSCMSSSLLEPLRHLEFHPAIIFNETQFINVKTLDSFQIYDCNFLNIDVQGYELEVLKGATETLKNVDYIVAEVNLVEHYKNAPLIDELDSFLHNFNFIRLETFFFQEYWGDALYVKKERILEL